MKLTFILSIFSFLSICNSFRLAQYNAEWLFIDQYENCPGSGCTWSNQSEAQKHLSVVATNINNINADYINFCEVEGVNELNMVAIAKLPQPIKSEPNYPINFIIRFDT